MRGMILCFFFFALSSLVCANEKNSEQDAVIYANTLDEVRPGKSKSESAHSLKSSAGTGSGEFINKTCQDAVIGKWFSYVLKTDPSNKNQLVCEYYGGETGGVFSIRTVRVTDLTGSGHVRAGNEESAATPLLRNWEQTNCFSTRSGTKAHCRVLENCSRKKSRTNPSPGSPVLS